MLREFLAEYLRLPAETFSPRQDARDPVAVWERSTSNSLMFYAVNRERFPATIAVELSPGAKVVRLSDNSAAALSAGQLRVTLEPYQLLAFRADAGSRITGLTTTVSPENRDRVSRQVHWMVELVQEQGKQWVGGLDADDKALLERTAKEATSALAAGHLWRTRTMLEDHRLLAIYRQLKRFPPELRDASSQD